MASLKKTPEELEEEANLLLYGEKSVPRKRRGTQYQLPKYVPKSEKLRALYSCSGCGKPRSTTSGSMCRSCYMAKAAKKRDAKDDKKLTVSRDFAFDGDEQVPVYYNEYEREEDLPTKEKRNSFDHAVRKLDEVSVKAIRFLYCNRLVARNVLARAYDVSESVIHNAVHKKGAYREV